MRLAGLVSSSVEARVTFPCSVLDLSATGAKVELVQSKYRVRLAEQLPDQVVLTLTTDRQQVSGRIMWRDGASFGVRFTSPFKRIKPSPG